MSSDQTTNVQSNQLIVKKASKHFEPSKEVYAMKTKPRGFCYIFHNYKSDNEKKFAYREGSERDCESLEHVFNELHFDVTVFPNVNANRIKRECFLLSKNGELEDHDALVVIFLSHGNNGSVDGIDGNPVDLNTIFSYFTSNDCQSLSTKPKMFFTSACRGTDVDVKVDDTEMDQEGNGAPVFSDMIMVYSTIPGYVSLRDPQTGTWFGYELSHALAEYAHDYHLEDIIKKVSREIRSKIGRYLRKIVNESGEVRFEEVIVEQGMVYQNMSFDKYLYFNP